MRLLTLLSVSLLVAPTLGGLNHGVAPALGALLVSTLAMAWGRTLVPLLGLPHRVPAYLVAVLVGYGAASLEPAVDIVSDTVIVSDEQRRVAACLDGLTDRQRECIQLAYYDGLTYPQVSERLSANLATVKSRMRDGLRSLRTTRPPP